MRGCCALVLLAVSAAQIASAQDLRGAKPEPVPPQVAPAPELKLPDDPLELLPAQPNEAVLVPALRGVIFVPDAAEAQKPVPPGFSGIDASRTPLVQKPDLEELLRIFLDKPASLPSLGRLAIALRLYLQQEGHAFFSVFVPPQDLTEGVVRIVARPARLEGEVEIAGAQYFSEEQYRRALRVRPGEPIDDLALQRDIDWLNRNPFRNAVIAAQPGAAEGTTRLGLRVRDQPPWRVFAGYDDTGTRSTGDNRFFAGVNWGNAFGRGDQLSYQYKADPVARRSESHSATYLAGLPWRHVLSAFGVWSRIRPDLPAPFNQQGESWQLGARYSVPLDAPRTGWATEITAGFDFKYSDNTLEFAATPIINNATHVVQGSLAYSLTHRGGPHGTRVLGALYASPGGLSSRNKDEFFAISRPGAKADYLYGRLDVQHLHALPVGFTWLINASAQHTAAALLGSEQLAGGGANAVRGYGETAAFGDKGVLASNELHLPRVSLASLLGLDAMGPDNLDLFGFYDAAFLRENAGGRKANLRSIGIGLNFQLRNNLTLRSAYGRQLRALDGLSKDSRSHIMLQISF